MKFVPRRFFSCSCSSSSSSSMMVFNRTAKRVQRDRCADTFGSVSFLHEAVAQRLVDRLDDIKDRQFNDVLDLGCGTGLTSRQLIQRSMGNPAEGAASPSSPPSPTKAAAAAGTSGSSSSSNRSASTQIPCLQNLRTIQQVEMSTRMLGLAKQAASDALAGRYVGSSGGDTGQRPTVSQAAADDEENLSSFASESLDLVISNLSMHWINDLPGLFSQINRLLRPDGVFLGSLFGEQTLYQLRSAFALAEQERDGGLSPHVSPFAGIGDMGNLLTRTGFSLPTVDMESFAIHYKSMFHLMEDLQTMGENNSSSIRRLHVPRNTFLAAAAAYDALYRSSAGGTPGPDDPSSEFVPATFQVIYFIGWKPHESQPKPAQRGSHDVSLRDAFKQ